MSTDGELTGNKGEWSEFYTFCYLLNSGVLKTADRNLIPSYEISLPIIRIIRKDSGNESSYYTGTEEKNVKLFIGESQIDDIDKTEFEKALKVIYNKFGSSERSGAFGIPEIASFMKKIRCSKIKADQVHKEDIRIQVHDVMTGQDPVQGFSIKSYIGNDPTLLNAGKTTNFRFLIEGCDDDLMKRVNSIDTKTKIMDRMGLITSMHNMTYESMYSDAFRKNLQIIDSQMPRIIAELLLIHYMTGVTKISDAVNILEKSDPLGMDNRGYYEYKVKLMLRSIALGMIPSEPWYGKEDANGGYIVVKDDGDVVCFFLYNRNEFDQYLFECTKFERASTSRHDYMKVEKDKGGYHINLNLQIRFMKPGAPTRNKQGTESARTISLDNY